MKQYYYANGDQQLGPFSFPELQSKNLQKDTYVWYEGLTDWTRAGDLPELNVLFEAPPEQIQTRQPPLYQTPPPPAQQTGGYQQPQNQGGYQQRYEPASGIKPKTWLVEAILTTVLCCLIGGIIGIVYASQVDTKWAQGDVVGAQKASDNAKLWVMISAGIGLVIVVFYLIAFVASAGGGF
ncbi:MAG: hypothetical protein ACI8VT_002709 [Saprospiraceae bacterium]|jgi:hypothetical protein